MRVKVRMRLYLSPLNGDDAVELSGGVIKEGDGDSRRRRRDPRSLCLGVDVEHVRLARKYGLLPV